MTRGGRDPVLQLTKSGARTLAGVAGLDGLRDELREAHCVRLPGLIDRPLLEAVIARLDRGSFITKTHGAAAEELCLEADETVGLLHFLVNDPAVYSLVEHVGECAPIRSFFGRVYRHLPEGGHYQHWHGDVEADRRVGMSINLSADAYEGGVFEIRQRDADRLSASVLNTGFGDAILFRLREDLEHRVTALRGRHAKTAFAGWFRSTPDYIAVLRGEQPVAS